MFEFRTRVLIGWTFALCCCQTEGMRHRIFFLITARDVLLAKLGECGEDASLLTDSQLWSADHFDRSDWTFESRGTATKLLFLARLRQQYGGNAAYEAFLGAAPISIQTFDEWWSITFHEVDEYFERVEAEISSEILRSISKPGHPALDAWLDGLIRNLP